MQYTGLKDKKEKGAYGGDKIKFNGAVYRIEWVQDFLTWAIFTEQEWEWYKSGSNHFKYYRTDEERSYFLHELESYEFEIIGNI
ncbi:unnamed protein product, partial [marine sediment metagenome]